MILGGSGRSNVSSAFPCKFPSGKFSGFRIRPKFSPDKFPGRIYAGEGGLACIGSSRVSLETNTDPFDSE